MTNKKNGVLYTAVIGRGPRFIGGTKDSLEPSPYRGGWGHAFTG